MSNVTCNLKFSCQRDIRIGKSANVQSRAIAILLQSTKKDKCEIGMEKNILQDFTVRLNLFITQLHITRYYLITWFNCVQYASYNIFKWVWQMYSNQNVDKVNKRYKVINMYSLLKIKIVFFLVHTCLLIIIIIIYKKKVETELIEKECYKLQHRHKDQKIGLKLLFF